jgi:chromosome partitioning protein
MTLKLSAINLRGGNGKTTSTYMIACLLAKADKSVLCIDLDPRAYLTQVFQFNCTPEVFSARELLDRRFNPFKSIHPTIIDNIDIIPAHEGLDQADALFNNPNSTAIKLKDALQQITRVRQQYDYILIDSAAGRSNLTLNAISASDEIIIPAEPNSKGLYALIQTLSFIEDCRRRRFTSAHILGILPFRDKWIANTQLKTSIQTIQAMHQLGHHLFTHVLDRNIFVQALAQAKLPRDFSFSSLELPYLEVVETLLSISILQNTKEATCQT